MHCQFCGAALEKISEACPFCGSQVVLGDRYEIRAVLGRGAMGEVFYAYDRRLANEVALKRLNPQLTGSQELRESLTREARIMARLSDAGIVRLFDLADFESGLYLVLEYVCGPNLREMLRAGYRATPVELVVAMQQICQALTAAHNNGVIHRDLKPSNLLVGLRSPERDAWLQARAMPQSVGNATIKIADFGIAKAIAESKSTLTNAFSGTPGYMAPEQFRGETPSPATDVYALGVMGYELLTGKLPAQPMPAIADVHPLISNVLGIATHPDRQQRFQTAGAFYGALYNAVEGKPFERPILRPARAPISRSQRAAAAAALAVAGFAAIAALTFSTGSTDHPRQLTPIPSMPDFHAPDPPVKIESKPALRAEGPPPPVADASGRLPETGLVGPRSLKVKWRIAVNAIAVHGTAVGTDGTFYSTAISGDLFAIRDGKLAWSYKTNFGGIGDPRFDNEGRVWLDNMQDIYCFNRDGQGGRMPAGVKAPHEKDSARYTCMGGHTLWGPGMMRIDLDGDCGGNSVAARPGGGVYVGTDIPQIQEWNAHGQPTWTYKPACAPETVLAPDADRLIYTCKDSTIHNLSARNETWSHAARGSLSNHMLVGGDGILYYSDSPERAGSYALHALDGAGKELGSVELGGDSVSGMYLGAQKQLYVTTSSINMVIFRLED